MTKNVFILLLAFLSFGFVCASANEEVSLLFKQEKYEGVVDELAPATLKSFEEFELLVQAHLAMDLDDAEDAVVDLVSAFPDDYRAHLLYASVMGSQASNGIFGALGYAKKAKTGLQKAVELAPENIDAINGLVSFYLAAPSIAGGDKEEALRLVGSISKLDATEGQFAKARYLMSTDEFESAVSALNPLIENEETKARALFVLAQFYQQAGDTEKAFSQYKKVLASELSVTGDMTDKSEERAHKRLLLAKYRIGQLAINETSYSDEGIEGLNQYIGGYLETPTNVYGLPSLSWARLRLIELLMNANKVEEARALVPMLSDLGQSRFKKTRKQLLKRLKKA